MPLKMPIMLALCQAILQDYYARNYASIKFACLVGGAISIRDPYICAVSRVCAKESHQARCLWSENVAIGFKPA